MDREGRVPKIVEKLDQTSFSGPRAIAEGKEILYVTERCVMKLTSQGLMVTEIAPGIDLQSQILDQAEVPLLVSSSLKEMDGALFQPSMVAELARNKEAA